MYAPAESLQRYELCYAENQHKKVLIQKLLLFQKSSSKSTFAVFLTGKNSELKDGCTYIIKDGCTCAPFGRHVSLNLVDLPIPAGCRSMGDETNIKACHYLGQSNLLDLDLHLLPTFRREEINRFAFMHKGGRNNYRCLGNI
ncbi:hypothetical protein RRG08_043027 [Elysia crispata]|uniref:Uncharacterized protein n=1 Tax=Elysia crispata TaxID=231223 RepID=A0AAE0XY09_9GAST|nr:hypothetical protein RRG08_043027 [Elysia crispata]